MGVRGADSAVVVTQKKVPVICCTVYFVQFTNFCSTAFGNYLYCGSC